MNGILLLNKAAGFTSNGELQRVKRLFNATKAGHTGSLDPIATGMLPICLGEATKFSQFGLNADKSYLVVAQFGKETTTGDYTGAVVQEALVPEITLAALEAVVDQFKGKSMQVPPMYAALKHQGKPLYKYARAGIEIERAPRQIEIYHLSIKQFSNSSRPEAGDPSCVGMTLGGTQFTQPQVTLEVTCSKGTYIRSLVMDIGKALNTCAHVLVLHRTMCAGFNHKKIYSFAELSEFTKEKMQSCLLSCDTHLSHLPALHFNQDEITQLYHGKQISIPVDLAGSIRLYNSTNTFIGVGIATNGSLRVQRLTAVAA